MKNNKVLYLLVFLLIIWCIALTVFISNQNNETNEIINKYEVDGFSTDLTEVVEKCKNSIVTVDANGEISTGFVYKQINNKIYILTSYHGVADASKYNVYFSNNLSFVGEVIGFNEYADIAVIEIESPYSVEALGFADTNMLSTGEFVVSIGTPLSIEYDHSVEFGMISNNIKTILNSITIDSTVINYYLDVVQISSNLKPGYSGSPLLNMDGKVVGMTTMSLDETQNFAITANEVKIIADKLINGKNVKKYQLGIKGSYITNMPLFERTNLNLPVDIISGLYVETVMPNTAASLLELKNGDVISEINGTKITNINDYFNIVYNEQTYFELIVYRDGGYSTLRVDIND